MNFHRLFFAFIALSFFCDAAPALAQRQNNLKLLGLSVEGNKTADGNFIKLSSALNIGQVVTGDDLQNAIKQLWSLDMFEDVALVLDRQVGDGIYLTIRVKEFPRLNKIELDGNTKIKKKDLEKELTFFKGQIISPRESARTSRKLKKFYEDKGYLLAEIQTELTPAGIDDQVNLLVKIQEGNKVQIKSISFHGNTAFDDGKLRKQLKGTKPNGLFGGGDFDEDKFREDKAKVVEFYREHGLRDAEVLRDSIYYSADKKAMFIDIWVDEGQKYFIGDVTWEGNKLYPDWVLASRLGFSKGDEFNSKQLQEAVVERLGSMYYDAGYIFATVNPVEKVAEDNKVNLHFLVTEGNAVTINRIQITGNTKTKEKVIRRELYVRPGDVFSREALIRSQREIFVLNYFSDVKPDVRPISDEKVDVLVEVTEKSTDTANMSAGWSERDKIIGAIGIAMNNFLGNGQRLSFDWNFGKYYRSFQVGFTEPWLFGTPTLASLSIFDTKRSGLSNSTSTFGQFDYYAGRSQGLSVRLGRRLSWPDNYFRLDGIYRFQKQDYTDVRVRTSTFTSSSITAIFSRNSLNRPEFPTAGSQVSLTSELAGGPLYGNVGFYKHEFDADWFFPTFGQFVLFVSFKAGYLDKLSSGSQIPYLDYFYMGGEGLSNSIALRGYEDPLRAPNPPLDRTMLKYQAEFRIPISPNPTIFALTFAEAGNTWPDLARTNPSDLRRAVGVGARLFMPLLGIIGFDYAYGFDYVDPITGRRFGRWKPHFVFGKSF